VGLATRAAWEWITAKERPDVRVWQMLPATSSKERRRRFRVYKEAPGFATYHVTLPEYLPCPTRGGEPIPLQGPYTTHGVS